VIEASRLHPRFRHKVNFSHNRKSTTVCKLITSVEQLYMWSLWQRLTRVAKAAGHLSWSSPWVKNSDTL